MRAGEFFIAEISGFDADMNSSFLKEIVDARKARLEEASARRPDSRRGWLARKTAKVRHVKVGSGKIQVQVDILRIPVKQRDKVFCNAFNKDPARSCIDIQLFDKKILVFKKQPAFSIGQLELIRQVG